MPFTLESDNLPTYVKKQPLSVAKKWIEIFNKYFESDDEGMAWHMANAWLQRVIEFHKNNKPTEEPKNSELEIVNVNFKPEKEEIVIRADGDEEFIDFILADVDYDNYGTAYEENFLLELAEQINNKGILGDFNHELQYKFKEMGLSIDSIKQKMQTKNGIAKAVKAIVDKGKLFIRTTFDKRYKKRILESKGVSIEGAFIRNKLTNKFEGGTVFGFSFIDNENLKLGNPRATKV